MSTTFTVYCELPGQPEWTEEVDVQAVTEAEALAEAQAELDRDYLPGMKAVRAIRRAAGWLFL